MKLSYLALSLFVLTTPLAAQEFVVNLKDPEYVNGVIKTDKGGIITAPSLRIQARSITYINENEEQKICAEGDLMMEYRGKIFIGERLEFDLLKKTGCLIGGRTNIGIWYIGGERIELYEDGDFVIFGAFITTSTDDSNPWELSAYSARVTDGHILNASDVRFKVLDKTLFWVPVYKSDLKRTKDPPFRYRVLWDKKIGPRLSLRYRFYATENFGAFARLDYRPQKTRFGGALETNYLSPDKRTLFQTKSYGAKDKSFPSQPGDTFYRFQGIFKTRSEDDLTRFHAQWDRFNSQTMVSSFRDPDFEINTQKATYVEFSHYKDWSFFDLTGRFKANDFDALAQELPYGVMGIRPFEIWKTGIISENYVSGAYLDYTYTDSFHQYIKDRKAGRIETLNHLYRPFSLWGVTLTPKVGLAAIYYSQSPKKQATGQLVYSYGGDANMRFSREFDGIKHLVEPYARYLGLTRPQTPVNKYFVFDIHDGYDRIDQLRFGIRQNFYSKSHPIFLPMLTIDLYSYSFWGARSFDQRIPKLFADIHLNRPNYAFVQEMGWNLQEGVLDYNNSRLLYTVNSSFAFGVEYRYRSQYWWRKAIYTNYVVDFARPLDELLASPLSDRRQTVLTKAHFRFSPRWALQMQYYHGWGRSDEPKYDGAKVDLYTMLTGSWQMKFSYEFMPNDPYRISYSFNLVK
jgi:hypothetical protein